MGTSVVILWQYIFTIKGHAKIPLWTNTLYLTTGYKHVQCELKDGVAVIRLNSPGVKVTHACSSLVLHANPL